MQGLILSGVDLAVTVGNVVHHDAFKLDSFSHFIYGGSVVIEVVGYCFAIGMSVRLLLYPVVEDMVGVGVLAVVFAQTMFMLIPSPEIRRC